MNSFSLKKIKILVLIPIVMLCTSCVLGSNIRVIPESEKGVSSNIQGTYANREGEVSVVGKLGSNRYRFLGPKNEKVNEDLEKDLSGMKEKEMLDNLTAKIAEERSKKTNAEIVRYLEKVKSQITAGKDINEIIFRDDLVFATSDLERGWFIVQVLDVLSEGFNVLDYMPEKFDILVGRYMNNSLNLYKTEDCIDSGLASRYEISIVGKKIVKYDRFSDFKKFMWACIKEKKLQPRKELSKS